MNLSIDARVSGPSPGPSSGTTAASGRIALRPALRGEGSASIARCDAADISPAGRELLRCAQASEETGVTDESENRSDRSSDPTRGAGEDLTEEEEREVQDLDRRDREVRAHEQAHAAAGGAYVRGGPSYEFEVGPDGERYAVNGHVSIDVSPEKDPHATIQKMRQVKQAATAPANPSASDRQVAAKAAAEEAKARQQLMEESGASRAPPDRA